jgi:hypothetical protein
MLSKFKLYHCQDEINADNINSTVWIFSQNE